MAKTSGKENIPNLIAQKNGNIPKKLVNEKEPNYEKSIRKYEMKAN